MLTNCPSACPTTSVTTPPGEKIILKFCKPFPSSHDNKCKLMEISTQTNSVQAQCLFAAVLQCSVVNDWSASSQQLWYDNMLNELLMTPVGASTFIFLQWCTVHAKSCLWWHRGHNLCCKSFDNTFWVQLSCQPTLQVLTDFSSDSWIWACYLANIWCVPKLEQFASCF